MEQQSEQQQNNDLSTYIKMVNDLDEFYDLEQLELEQNIDYQNNIDKARQEFDKSLMTAKQKGQVSTHELGRAIKKVLMEDVVSLAMLELEQVGTRTIGHNLEEDYGRLGVLQTFNQIWTDYHALFGKEITPEETHEDWERMIFLAFNLMIDQASISRTNDFTFQSTDHFEEKSDAKRKSLQQIYAEVGDRCLFQLHLTLMKRFYPNWFSKTYEDCDKQGLSSYAYFSQNFKRKSSDYLGWRTGLNFNPDSNQTPEQRERDQKKLQLLNQVSLLRDQRVANSYGGINEDNRFKVVLGSWLCSMIENSTDIFVQVPRDPFDKSAKRRSVLTYGFSDGTYDVILGTIRNRAFYKTPLIAPPLPITKSVRGGSQKTKEKPPVQSHKGNLEMSDTRLAFYQRQSMVPFRINGWVFDLLTILKDQNLVCGGFDYYFRSDYEPTPSDLLLNEVGIPDGWDGWEQKQKDRWCRNQPAWRRMKDKVKKQKERHQQRMNSSAPNRSIYHLAERYKDREAIWFPVAPEFRGRIMTDCGLLNYQGRDSAKALIDLARPVELQTEEQVQTARKWITNHLASCFGASLDKKPFDTRIHKVNLDTFQRDLISVATMLDEDGSFSEGFKVLEQVVKNDGKPLMFARACKEFYDLFIAGNKTHTNLLCGVDATCSGQQIQAGWTRSKRLAKSVNLLPNPEPQDLYGEIWKVLWEMIEDCVVVDDEGRHIKVSWSIRNTQNLNQRGMGRTIVKGAFQPLSYGSGKKTSVQGILNKIEKLRKQGSLTLSEPEILAVKNNIEKAINEVSSVGIVNKWFRHFAERCKDEGLPYITIPTMLGDHIKMVYETFESATITTFKSGSMTYRRNTSLTPNRTPDRTGGRGQRLRFQVPTGSPDHDKWLTGLPANTTHSAGDATILADCLHDAEFDFATQHDAIYVCALDVDEVRDRFRRSYVKVAKFDIFEELQRVNGVRVDPTKVVDPRTMDEMWDTMEEDVLHSDYIIN